MCTKILILWLSENLFTNQLNIELFIAKRLTRSKDHQDNISRPIVSVAIAGIALGMIVMLMSIAIVTGFKAEIRNKVFGFGAHLQIINYDSNVSYETKPILNKQDFLPKLKRNPGIRHIQSFATKAGIIKTKSDIEGVVVKGIGNDFDWTFFSQYIVEGKIFNVCDTVKSDMAVISKILASKLKLKVGDKLPMYFIQDSPEPRMRKFIIGGIYETSLEEFDKLYVLVDIAHIQKLNNWKSNQISGFEILLKDVEQIDRMKLDVEDQVMLQLKEGEDFLKVVSIKEKFPQLFDWLELQDMNVWIILGLMIIVAGFNMVSGLLILILERTNMIGILKSLGAQNFSIRKVFLYQAAMLIGKGLLIGNIVGISLCLLQHYTGIVKLDPAAYYVTEVPVSLSLYHIVLLNLGTLAVTVTMLIVPSFIITKISPVKAIQFN